MVSATPNSGAKWSHVFQIAEPLDGKSFFLLGPRGTGKSTWVRQRYPDAPLIDLLEARVFNPLLADPQRLAELIPAKTKGPIIIDEVQKVPALLDEVHRLIERRRLWFILTGSSARKLHRGGHNLLAGRALTLGMHPLTASEMGVDFDLQRALRHGLLPASAREPDPERYLQSYVKTYLEEEVRQEGLTRNLAAFARFLEAAAFSQGSLLNVSAVARECSVNRKVAESYFEILTDLMLAHRLPVFTRRAKRRLVAHPKFYYFDVGVFRSIRPMGPLDAAEEAESPALETLVLQHLIAINDGLNLGYTLHYWRTADDVEVDFVLYGRRGLFAIEVKRGQRAGPNELRGLRSFLRDYPVARAFLVHDAEKRTHHDGIEAIPIATFLKGLPELLRS